MGFRGHRVSTQVAGTMKPILWSIGGLDIPAYAVFVLLGMFFASNIRRVEMKRIGQTQLPGMQWVSVGALVGAVFGSKLGMLLFESADSWHEHLRRALSFDFSGRTVVGGLIGGYLGVEATKRWVGIQQSTGDGWAVALPVAQGIGRIGCFFHGCCYGAAWSGPWAVQMNGVMRHPAQLYESAADLLLAAWLWRRREHRRPAGDLFRLYLVGYAAIRVATECVRGDAGRWVGPLTAVQCVCVVALVHFVRLLRRSSKEFAGAES